MLEYLRIEGLALIDELCVELSGGMNVLTGETGAGKSMIVDSLTLLRGAKGRGDLVREGASQAHVQAQFVLAQDDPRLQEALEGCEVELEDRALLVSRRMGKHGRGRSSVQGRLTTLGGLSEVGQVLMDICSQHEHHSLTHVSRHIELLDNYAKLGPALEGYRQAYSAWRKLVQERDQLRTQAQDRGQRLDFLRFVLSELDAVTLDPAAHEEAKARRELLRNAQHWVSLTRDCKHALYEADDSVWGKMAALIDRVERGNANPPPAVSELLEHLRGASVLVEEANGAADRLLRSLDGEGDLGQGVSLDELEEQISEIDHLQRKHGCDLAGLVAKREQLREELDTLTNVDDHMQVLEQELQKAFSNAKTLALSLRQSRTKASSQLCEAISKELAALHMPKARFALEFRELEGEDLGATGLDQVEFVFSANPGEPMGPLHKVASGGELSRVLLAIKGVLSTGDCVVTYVFDEVDTGVGGAVAEAIGHRLQRTAQERQVLCVTHLPQIAAFAERHLFVEKRTTQGRTVTSVRTLEMSERIEELARMLGGAKVTQSAREHARALLQAAGHTLPTKKSSSRARA